MHGMKHETHTTQGENVRTLGEFIQGPLRFRSEWYSINLYGAGWGPRHLCGTLVGQGRSDGRAHEDQVKNKRLAKSYLQKN